MADFNKKVAEKRIALTGSAGNKSEMVEDYDSLAVMAADDIFYVMTVAKSSLITGAKLTAEAGFSQATGTLNFGLIMDGTSYPVVFGTGLDSVTGGQLVSTAHPFKCTEDAVIIVTPKTAGTVIDKRLSVSVDYLYIGDVA